MNAGRNRNYYLPLTLNLCSSIIDNFLGMMNTICGLIGDISESRIRAFPEVYFRITVSDLNLSPRENAFMWPGFAKIKLNALTDISCSFH